MRIAIAKKRHDKHFLYELNKNLANPHEAASQKNQFILGMMPSRKQWRRPNFKTRQHLNSKKIVEISILETIKKSQNKDQKWLHELNKFTSHIQHTALNPLPPPEIMFAPKDPLALPGPNKEYRPIALYNPREQIIIGIAAKMTGDAIDFLFKKNSYAFRKAHNFDGKAPTHHDAVNSLLEFIGKHKDKKLFVAECDIQKFYDSVNHKIVRKKFRKLLFSAKLKNKYYDPRIKIIFDHYLESYSFQKTVEPEFKTQQKNGRVKEGKVPWVHEVLKKFYGEKIPLEIGVPQGGALSTNIANIVLHEADLNVLKQARRIGVSEEDFFYARYCDDMIIISINKKNYLLLIQKILRNTR